MSYIDRLPKVGDYVAYFPNNAEEPERFGRVVEVKPWAGLRRARAENFELEMNGGTIRPKPGEPVWVETDRCYVAWQDDFENHFTRRKSYVDIRTLRVIDKDQIPHICDPRPRMVWRHGEWHFDPPHCSCQDVEYDPNIRALRASDI